MVEETQPVAVEAVELPPVSVWRWLVGLGVLAAYAYSAVMVVIELVL